MALKNAIELANRHDEMDEDVEELDAVLGQLIVALDEVETVVGASDGEIIPSDLVRETKARGISSDSHESVFELLGISYLSQG